MAKSISRSHRRKGVIVNHAGLLGAVGIVVIGSHWEWNAALFAFGAAAVLAWAATFVQVFVKTGLWKRVHTEVTELDEREVHVNHEALRHSYAIFAIVALLVVLATGWLQMGSNLVRIVAFWSLLYLSHSLPASFIAWSEKEI